MGAAGAVQCSSQLTFEILPKVLKTFGAYAKGNLLPVGTQNHDGQCLGSGLLAGGRGVLAHLVIILSQIFLLQISRSDSTRMCKTIYRHLAFCNNVLLKLCNQLKKQV